MSLPALLFSTYYRVYPVGQMGVFKRCIRLMDCLMEEFDIHVINYGPLPEREPLFLALRDRLTIHDTVGETGPLLHKIMERVRPRALVLGEAPLRGAMRMAHRVAARLGIRQVAIDNFYYPSIGAHFASEWPVIDRWLLLGLLDRGAPSERILPQCVVVPPLVRFPPDFGSLERDRIVILGYDPQTLTSGLALLKLLARREKVDFLVSPDSRALLEKESAALDGTDHRILVLPTDAAMYESLSRARFVFGKAGYQQVVETLLLGAPILVGACGGGIVDDLIAPHLKPSVRIMKNEWELPELAREVMAWMDRPPLLPWPKMASAIPDTIQFAAQTLSELIRESATGAMAPRKTPVEPFALPGFTAEESEPFVEFRRMIEGRRWDDLCQRMNGATVWLFESPVTVAEFVEILKSLFEDALDLKLLPMAVRNTQRRDTLIHFSRTCTMIWGEPASWKEHEMDFDLHIGAAPDGPDWRIAYVGVTGATPQNVGSG